MSRPRFDVLTTNAIGLQRLLQTQNVTSVQIVEEYFAQIDRYEAALNTFISAAPRDKVLQVAASLDEERLLGNTRGPLHGIPVVLKDCFITAPSLGMSTTLGSWAFVGAKAKANSAIAQKLIDAGLIILGKTNMTEFAGMKMTMMTPGWSAHGGQTLSSYVRRIEEHETLLGHSAPGGSSTGSAVAVASGFSPLAMGTETIGSIITPSSRAALYAIKPTVGVQDATGLYTMTDFFDSPGPMAKCAGDLVAITEILLGRTFRSQDSGSWKGLAVAFLDPHVWKMSEEICRQHEGTAEQMREEYEDAISRIKAHGCSVKYPVDLTDISALTVDGKEAVMPIAFWDFKNLSMPRFIEAFDECPVGSVEDIVNSNEQNKEKALPPPYTEQNDLIKSLSSNENADDIVALKGGLRGVAKRIINEVLDREEVNIIAAPADSSLCIYAAAAGYPIATVPLGQLKYNGRPFGLCLLARENDEGILLRFMEAYELASPPRPIPDL